jgi:hypothetical protein
MDITWVKLISWHAARPKDHADTTYCGRQLPVGRPISDVLPAGKSCELCLRIIGRLNDDERRAD